MDKDVKAGEMRIVAPENKQIAFEHEKTFAVDHIICIML